MTTVLEAAAFEPLVTKSAGDERIGSIAAHESMAIFGPAGVGKSWMPHRRIGSNTFVATTNLSPLEVGGLPLYLLCFSVEALTSQP
jgi:putative ribosome biogenesis GTPase RsgA